MFVISLRRLYFCIYGPFVFDMNQPVNLVDDLHEEREEIDPVLCQKPLTHVSTAYS